MNCKEDSKILTWKISTKVTAIEESNVLNTIHVEELVGSLQTYESTFLYQKKGKSITLKSSREKHDYSSNNDINNEDIALIAKKFRKFKLKKKKTNKGKKVNDFVKRNESENESKIKIESKEKVKCFECSGYDHLRSECLNFKRYKGKALNVTLNDESDSKNSNSSSDNKFAFVAFSDTVNKSIDMKQTVEISCDSDTDQTIRNYSDLDVTSVIVDHKLSL